MITELCRLAATYGTDKTGSYTRFYDQLLSHRRQAVKRVLEIGVGTAAAMQHVPGYEPGASLRMWRDYFPNAEILGADRDPAALFVTDRNRISIALADQSSAHDLACLALMGPFDLIVDDGSHRPADQILSATILSKCLTPDGIYIIEDVNEPLALPMEYACIQYHYTPELTGRFVIILDPWSRG